MLLLPEKVNWGKFPATFKALGKPSVEGRKPAPCGVRPSTQRAMPMFALMVDVGFSVSTKLTEPSRRLFGCPFEGPAGLLAPKKPEDR